MANPTTPPLYLIRKDRGLEKILDWEAVFEIESKNLESLGGIACDGHGQRWLRVLVPQKAKWSLWNLIGDIIVPKAMRDKWMHVKAEWTHEGQYPFEEFRQLLERCLKAPDIPFLIFENPRIILNKMEQSENFEALEAILNQHIFEPDDELLPFPSALSTDDDDYLDFLMENTLSPKDGDAFEELLQSYKGKSIGQVSYYQVNYLSRPFAYDGFHLCDLAILIQFTDGSWLNWIVVDESSGQLDYRLCGLDVRDTLLVHFSPRVDEMTNDPYWQKVIGKPLKSLSYKHPDDPKVELYLMELTLSFEGGHSITICATEEPNLNQLPLLSGLPYFSDWTVVVFDEAILKKFDRGKYGPGLIR